MTKTVLMKRALVVLAVGLIALVYGCSAIEAQRIETMERERDVGEGFLAARNIPRAIYHLQKAQQAYPKEPSVYFDLGLAFQAKGEPEKATEYFNKAIKLKPNYSEAYLQLGNLEFDRKNYKGAISRYKKALENELYTTPHFAHFNIGRVHHVQKNYAAAIERYERSLRLVPDYTDAHYFRGALYLELKEPDKALKSLEKAVLYGQPYPRAKMTMGKALIELGQKEKAVKALKECLGERPPEDVAKEAKRLLKLLGEAN